MAKKPEWLKELPDGSMEITLAKPLEVMGAMVTVVTMREPTVADQEASQAMEGSDATREINEFANLCQLAPDDIRKMSLRNYQRVRAAYLSFIV